MGTTSELDQAQNPGFRTEPRSEMDRVSQNSNQLKCSENLRSAVRTAFVGNSRFALLMILSVVPLFAFMIVFEIQLQKLIQSLPDLLDFPHLIFISVVGSDRSSDNFVDYPIDSDSYSYIKSYQKDVREDLSSFSDPLKLCLFYLIVYPLAELFTIFITIKCTSKKHSGETQLSLKQILCQNSFAGMFMTYLCVHLLSALSLLGLFWEVVILLKHFLLMSKIWHQYYFNPIDFSANVLYIGFYAAIFVVVLYKFLGWSAYWNLSVVISVLEEETGIRAFVLADYYGKHHKRTGFQLMLIFFAFCNFPRLPAALFLGSSSSGFAGICVIAVVMGLFCLGNSVKWVAFVLYFYECKQKVMEKKGDEDVGKSTKAASDAC